MVKIDVSIPGREELHLELTVNDQGQIQKSQVKAVGGWDFLKLVQEFRQNLKGAVKDLVAPHGASVGALLIREAILKAQGNWTPPYCEEELCHCRGIPTEKVDLAILSGAHTPRQVSAQTSASTACGTCRPNVEAMISYRLGGALRLANSGN